MNYKSLGLVLITLAILTQPSSALFPTLVSQVPDINSTNLYGTDLAITYKMATNYSDINLSTVKIYFNTSRNGINNTAKINGVLIQPGGSSAGFNAYSTDGVNHTFNLPHDVVYPITANMIDANSSYSCASGCHIGGDYNTVVNPTNKNNVFKTRLYNVSNETGYNFFEAMVNVTNVTGEAPANVFFCNASYISGSLSTSPNCHQIGSFLPTTTFDHYHVQGVNGTLAHNVLPYYVDTVNGTIGSVKISPNDNYFAMRFLSTGWNIYYSNHTTAVDTTRLSINNGVSYSNLAGTLRWQVHKFNNNDIFSYYSCRTSLLNGTRYCSATTDDTISEASVPPQGAEFTFPNGDNANFANNTNITITWNPGVSLTDGIIEYYNLTLWKEGVKQLDIGNYTASTLSKSWNTSDIGEGLDYNFRMNTTSNKSLTTTTSSVTFDIHKSYTLTGFAFNVLEQPLQNIRIDVNGNHTFTDGAGYYTFTTIIENNYTVLARGVSFSDQSQNINLNADQMLNFTMTERMVGVKGSPGFEGIGLLAMMSIIYLYGKKLNRKI